MFAGLMGWHIVIVSLLLIAPLIGLAVGAPLGYAQGRSRRDQGLVTDPRVDPVAITAFVLCFVLAPVAFVVGLVARSRLRRSGQAGWGFAVVAVVWGGTALALIVLGLVLGGLSTLG